VKPFPSVLPYSVVAPADRASAIDFVNRVNWLFDTWDVDAMVQPYGRDHCKGGKPASKTALKQ
jgi:hypothetical protein